MADFYQKFVATRTTEPHLPSLQKQLQANDASAVLAHLPGTKDYTIKKSSAWTQQQITGTLNIINNAVTITNQLNAQDEIDNLRIAIEAIIFSLVDEVNILRALHSLPPRTYQGAIQTIRDKAGTL